MAVFKSAMLTRLFLLCYLTVGLATPILPRQANATSITFSLIAIHSGDSHIHLQTLEANGGTFWVGGPPAAKETLTYCPLPDQSLCPPGNTTELLARPGLGGVSMNTQVPGGQQVYVAPNGALRFTRAHSAFAPPGSSFGPFNITLDEDLDRVAEFRYAGIGSRTGGSDFWACPSGEEGRGPYQVFVDIEGLGDEDVPGGCVEECIEFAAVFFPKLGGDGPAAWQYT